MNKRIIIGFLSVVFLFFLGSATPNFHTNDPSLIINKIEISITGHSTVGKYNCSTTFSKNDTIFLNIATKNSIKAEIPMVKFDCGNKIMTKDLQSTVKVNQFPSSFVTLSNIRPFGSNFKCDLNFCITNKNRFYKDFLLKSNNNKIYGTIAFNFSDVGLTAPVKMAGLIKVEDQILVNFNLYKN
ncbi:hypothetical protein SAMN05444143_101644 [Flavobacterium succinicans]|uniref:YceI-like domain protein n=1 Tax=Flavobacterium succinicans TaxID=29536 RepID=A0A1I4S301_9FLAO|nr:hypothetical protein [Flavobacterium succinicans]SFM58888.1 hypothetical protein SAMN05444143_101644 [Flavobacterium succinicans]